MSEETQEAPPEAEAPEREAAQPEPHGAGEERRGSGAGRSVPLGKYVRIDSNARMPQFDRPYARAYAASDSREPGMSAYALICTEEYPPRITALAPLSRLDKSNIVPPADWGTVDWAEGSGQGDTVRRYAVVFDQPAGQVLAADPHQAIEPVREDKLAERVIRPFVNVLHEFASRGLTHRAICANNVYTGESAAQGMVLGECVSTPAGLIQPVLYETIPSGQADAVGRGAGTTADDIYALGALLAVMIRGGDPMPEASTAEIIARKIEVGSYAAVLGRTRLSLKMMEPLRGMLLDDPDERWTLEDLDMWLNGRQLSPKQAYLPHKARRVFHFEGQEYLNPRTLAHGLAQTWRPAAKLAVSGELEQWVERSLDDETQASMVKQAGAGAQQSAQGASGEDRALVRMLIALDPPAPIRLRSLAFRLDALPQTLALVYHNDTKRNAVADALVNKIPQRWLLSQKDALAQDPRTAQQFDRMAQYIGQQQIGFGLERCLYEYNPGWPCISPMVRGQFVTGIDQLLPALERRAATGPAEGTPIDRHIVAYLATRMEPPPDAIIDALGKAKDELTRRRAIIHLLARVQKRHGPRTLPALTAWIGEYARPIADALYNRKLRARAEKNLNRAIESGSLVDVLTAVDDVESKRRDLEGFAAAQQEYAALVREIDWLQDGGLSSDENVGRVTRSAATAISALLSGLVLMFLTLVMLL